MRILIIGAAGQLGSTLITRLASLGTVAGTDRAALDLRDLEAIPTALSRLQPELILNAAAYTAVDMAEEEPDLAHLINRDAPAVIARWAAENGRPLIHFSTDYVFDGSGEAPWSETDTPGPLSVYGCSKLAGEETVRAAGGDFLIVRTSWVYTSRGTNFLRSIARLAQDRTQLRIVADQTGAPTSTLVIADALHTILKGGAHRFRDLASEAQGIVHLTASGAASWHQFGTKIVEGLIARRVLLRTRHITAVSSEEYGARASRPKNSVLSLERLRDVFGISPPHWTIGLELELDEMARNMRPENRSTQ